MNLQLVTINPIPTQVTGALKDELFHCLTFDCTVYNLTIPNGRKREPITYSPDHADEVAIRATMGFKSTHIYYHHRPSNTASHRKPSPNLLNRNHDILQVKTYKSDSALDPKPPPDNNHILITTKSELHKHFRGER